MTKIGKRTLFTLCGFYLLSPASMAQEAYTYRWMGEHSCGAWPKYKQVSDPEKAVPLNWVLGYLSGKASSSNQDLLGNVDIKSVGAWLDNYCESHPLENISDATMALETELSKRSPK